MNPWKLPDIPVKITTLKDVYFFFRNTTHPDVNRMIITMSQPPIRIIAREVHAHLKRTRHCLSDTVSRKEQAFGGVKTQIMELKMFGMRGVETKVDTVYFFLRGKKIINTKVDGFVGFFYLLVVSIIQVMRLFFLGQNLFSVS